VAGQTHYADAVVERNMKESVDFAIHFFDENHVRRVLIGGTDENIALFRSLLPKAWQSLVVGVFPMGMTAIHSEVLAKAMQAGLEAEQKRQARLIDGVITAAAKGGGGAVGIDATLSAVHDGRVQTLLVSEGFSQPGYHCKACGYLSTVKEKACPMCGGAFEQVQDSVEHAVMDVMQGGGVIEVVHGGLALEQAGKIGAVLRY
jgi:peptide chain release factor subunit 1